MVGKFRGGFYFYFYLLLRELTGLILGFDEMLYFGFSFQTVVL